MTATTRKAKSAIQFCGSAIVKVPTGGRKKKLKASIAAIDVTMAIRSRAVVAAPSTTSSSASEIVVVLTSGITRSSDVTTVMAARLAMAARISRAGMSESTHSVIRLDPLVREAQPLL